MKIVIQRVSQASVQVNREIVASIGNGLLLFVGIREGDTGDEIPWLLYKVLNMRIFSDTEGKMNLSLADIGASVLLVSQFTLYAQTRKGNRPSFVEAARPEFAVDLFGRVVEAFELEMGRERVKKGIFGAAMNISLINDGPVTIIIEK